MVPEPSIQYLCRSMGAATDKGELMRIIARNPKNGESILDSVIADARFDKANTRLHLASSSSLFLQVLKACLRNTGCQASLELVDSEGLTPIMIACKCGNYEGVELLLEHGANAGYPLKDSSKDSPRDRQKKRNRHQNMSQLLRMTLHLWDYFGQMKKTFDFLQDHGACWDKINDWGYSGLQWAVQHTTTNVVAHLLTDNGLKVLQCLNPANGIHSPLPQAAIVESDRDPLEKTDLLRLALHYFTAPRHLNYQDLRKRTALMIAVSTLNLGSARLLVEAGADIDFEMSDGKNVRNGKILDDNGDEHKHDEAYERMKEFLEGLKDKPHCLVDVKPLSNPLMDLDREELVSRNRFLFQNLAFAHKATDPSRQSQPFDPEDDEDLRHCVVNEGFITDALALFDPVVKQSEYFVRIASCMILKTRSKYIIYTAGMVMDIPVRNTVTGIRTLYEDKEIELDAPYTLSLCIDVAQATELLHDRGFIHGSVDPNQVWVVEQNDKTSLFKLAEAVLTALVIREA
ncbi:ankyrin repeat-containing domain protein [Leptodontidium sp. 2 PMI_412]|nr:ankyrin repeat-containing domain protein [Leptodontidium sp. 2 PMI_412]